MECLRTLGWRRQHHWHHRAPIKQLSPHHADVQGPPPSNEQSGQERHCRDSRWRRGGLFRLTHAAGLRTSHPDQGACSTGILRASARGCWATDQGGHGHLLAGVASSLGDRHPSPPGQHPPRCHAPQTHPQQTGAGLWPRCQGWELRAVAHGWSSVSRAGLEPGWDATAARHQGQAVSMSIPFEGRGLSADRQALQGWLDALAIKRRAPGTSSRELWLLPCTNSVWTSWPHTSTMCTWV